MDVNKLTQIMDQFDAQQLSNTVYAFAKSGYASPELFDAVAVVADLLDPA